MSARTSDTDILFTFRLHSAFSPHDFLYLNVLVLDLKRLSTILHIDLYTSYSICYDMSPEILSCVSVRVCLYAVIVLPPRPAYKAVPIRSLCYKRAQTPSAAQC